MNLIRNIYSTLRTWVFKKKLLRFSSRFKRDPQACFYCPEMCRFSCPVSETLRDNSVTPRGKMSLLHLRERGFDSEKSTGSDDLTLWYLNQCTSCGRCTEYCVHEVDVATNLMEERRFYHQKNRNFTEKIRTWELSMKVASFVLFCENDRKSWWLEKEDLLSELGNPDVIEGRFPTIDWMNGRLSDDEIKKIADSLSQIKHVLLESSELGWFFADALVKNGYRGKIEFVWQRFFSKMLEFEFSTEEVFHESSFFSRTLPRLGYSIPMFERGAMPFHHGWSCFDCGGEGFYKYENKQAAEKMRDRFLEDLNKDGSKRKRIICQSLSCAEHLKQTDLDVVYWLDRLGAL
ncbi:MAG: 4Fe-4S dicluster domain-containing protein [Bacteriovoracia bacterium]